MQPRTYNSPEHESLRAVINCLRANFGAYGETKAREFIANGFRVTSPDELSPVGAYYCRKHLERALPFRGDFAQ